MSDSTLAGIEWVQSLQRFGIIPGLERTKKVLAAFGNPQDGLSFFHVAGTNGKGSVCAYLTAILSVTHRVGTFTSPAFDGFRARFMVAGVPISEQDFERLAVRVMECATQVTADDMLTEFEALTVMAILYFAECQVDMVVWETGLGGRYDSTNVVTPRVTAITNVSYDHTEILGNTLRLIASDKAGIIKPGIPVITGAQDDAYIVIEGVARTQKAPLKRLGVDFSATPAGSNPVKRRVNYRGLHRDIGGVEVGLFGRHQLENFSIALAMIEAAEETNALAPLSDEQFRDAMKQVHWPGRFEVHRVGAWPVVLDGAHNPAGARVCAQGIHELAEYEQIDAKWTIVLGVLGDKDAQGMVEPFLPFAQRIIAAQPQYSRALPAQKLAELVRTKTSFRNVDVIEKIEDATREALLSNAPVLIAGSLYTVDEARKAILLNSNIWKLNELGRSM